MCQYANVPIGCAMGWIMCQYANVPIGCAMGWIIYQYACCVYSKKHSAAIGTLAHWHIDTLFTLPDLPLLRLRRHCRCRCFLRRAIRFRN